MRAYLFLSRRAIQPRRWPDPYTFDPGHWLTPSSTDNALESKRSSSSDKHIVASDRNETCVWHTAHLFWTVQGACMGRKVRTGGVRGLSDGFC